MLVTMRWWEYPVAAICGVVGTYLWITPSSKVSEATRKLWRKVREHKREGAVDASETSIEKYQSRRVRAQIRHVLMDTWDPIGVKDEPNAQDEYNAYIGDIYELLISQAPDSKIAEYLYSVAHDRMGFSSTAASNTKDTVDALKAIPIDSAD